VEGGLPGGAVAQFVILRHARIPEGQLPTMAAAVGSGNEGGCRLAQGQ
jgi:hypothetical protein